MYNVLQFVFAKILNDDYSESPGLLILDSSNV